VKAEITGRTCGEAKTGQKRPFLTSATRVAWTGISVTHLLGFERRKVFGLGARTRQGRATPWGSESSYQVTPVSREEWPGATGGSFAGQQVRGSRLSGQAVPGDGGQGSRHRSITSRRAQAGAGTYRPRVGSVQGWTGALGPRSRRRDCMMANEVVRVKISMSAAASTPVYLAMTGAAVRSVTSSR
jgi:hypothetical protein